MAFKDVRGRAGETLAAAYLELTGSRLSERNTRIAGVEIDLVADDHGTMVLIEVKTRARNDWGGAALAIDARKRERLRRAALLARPRGATRVRIDVITIETDAEGARLVHHRNAIEE
jgi:putative endonuclease